MVYRAMQVDLGRKEITLQSGKAIQLDAGQYIHVETRSANRIATHRFCHEEPFGRNWVWRPDATGSHGRDGNAEGLTWIATMSTRTAHCTSEQNGCITIGDELRVSTAEDTGAELSTQVLEFGTIIAITVAV